MKTAMQELIEDLKSIGIKFNATKYLAKEKQDIIDAYKVGFSFGEDIPDKHANFMATDYFTQKYEQ